MICDKDKNENGTGVVVGLRRDDILDDVRNAAYIEGHLTGDGDRELRHMIEDVCAAGNVNRVARVLDLAVGELRGMLTGFMKQEVEREAVDNRLRVPEVYGLVLRVPANFPQHSLDNIARQAHEYAVCRIMGDWLSLTNPARAEVWQLKQADAERELRASLHRRTACLRRRLHVL